MRNVKQFIFIIGITCIILSNTLYAAEPIKIGLVYDMTGAYAQGAVYQLNGIKLAFDEINQAGGVLGRQLELEVEDNQSSNTGTILAFSKIVDKGDIVAVIGPLHSTHVLAILPSIKNAGIPTLIGGTDYILTHANNPWIFRFRPHDDYSAQAIAAFGVNTLKRKKWAIVYSTETFGVGGKEHLTKALKKLGVTPIASYGVRNDTQDFSLMVQSIKQSDADIIDTYLTSMDSALAFATQLRKAGVTISWIGSPSLGASKIVRQSGSLLYGTYSVADFVPDATQETQAFSKKYKEKYGLDPDFFSSWTYDAANILARAIKNANSVNPDAIRRAMLAIKGYEGVEGTYTFDQNGDGLHSYYIVKNQDGKIISIKHMNFD